MILDEKQKKLLSRILVDSPAPGDGQEFVKLLGHIEVDALRRSIGGDDTQSRLFQGQAMLRFFLLSNRTRFSPRRQALGFRLSCPDSFIISHD